MHPWQKIPYSDYEKHMKNKNVYQLQTLNQIFASHLKLFSPKSVMVLGCGAGNGFENIDTKVTKTVIGLDINSKYLELCKNVYSSKDYTLNLINCDFEKSKLVNIKADFISCSLFLEYVNIDETLKKIHELLKDSSHLSVVIQRSNNISFVSKTHVESLNLLNEIAKEVDEEYLEKCFIEQGYRIVEKKTFKLPNGKEFIDYICTIA